jgi:DNA-directed RNA polymerase specialized sigma24 family protein
MATSTVPHQLVAPDAHLVTRAQAGDTAAFDELVRRHAHPAWRVAAIAGGDPTRAGDAVAEAFTRVMQRIERGGVLPSSFRLAVAEAARSAALRGSARAATPAARPVVPDAGEAVRDTFRGLPERWRTALWLTAVEQGSAAQAGVILGVASDDVAALARRAENGLRERFLAGERTRDLPDACRQAIDDDSAAEAHRAECDDCRARFGALADLRSSLRPLVAVVPAALAATTAGHWLTWRQASGRSGRRLGIVGPVPEWAERAVAGAAAGVLALGLTGALLLDGRRDNSRELAAPLGALPDARRPVATAPADTGFTYTPTFTSTSAPPRARDRRFASTSTDAAPGTAPGTAPTPSTSPPTDGDGPAPLPPVEPPPPEDPAEDGVQIDVDLAVAGTPIGVSLGTESVGLQVGDVVVGEPATEESTTEGTITIDTGIVDPVRLPNPLG